MGNYDCTRKMLTEVLSAKNALPEVYNFLPRNDFYRLKQLFEEAEIILNKYK